MSLRVLVGLASDTHDREPVARRAADLFRERGVRFVLHAGDVTTPRTLLLFRDFEGALAFGNNDGDEAGLSRAARDMGWASGASWAGRIDGARVALVHGHRAALLADALAARPDYLVRGHNHRVQDEAAENGTRVLNPGAMFRARRYTAALLDTRTGVFEVVDLPKDP